MAKINALLKLSVLLTIAALALVPYASAFEVVGDDMDYILSHVSSEEWEAAKKLWSRTIQLNIDEGSEISPDLGVVLEPSRSEWGIKRDPSNPGVYILTLTGLPQKPFSEQKAQTATAEPLSSKEKESNEAEKIAIKLWESRSNDYDNITFTVESTGSKWLIIPLNPNTFRYGKIDAEGRVGNTIEFEFGEGMSIEEAIAEWTAEGKDVSQLIALQKQIEELNARYKSMYEQEAKEAAASSSKAGKKEKLIAIASVEEQTVADSPPTVKESVKDAGQATGKQEVSSPVSATKISSDKKADDSQQASEPAAVEQRNTEQSPKKRLSFFERILSWFR